MDDQSIDNQPTQPQIQLEITNNSPTIVNDTDKKSEADLVPVEQVQAKTENKIEPIKRVSLELDRNLDLDIFGFIIPEGSSPVYIDPNTVRRREKKMERND